MPEIAAADFARRTMPVLVFRSGKSDMAHTRRTSEWVHELLPNARRGRFERWPLIAPAVLEFLRR